MELVGTTSWRFAMSADDHLLHVALFVRDAVGLPVVSGPTVPPRLAGAVPGRIDALRVEKLQDVGRQWVGWWGPFSACRSILRNLPRRTLSGR